MKIAFIGDIAFFGKYDLSTNDELYEYFSDVKKIIDNCDYCVGNLEAPFVNNRKKRGNKSAYISSPVENARVLSYLGVKAVSLANNHIFDFGDSGFNDTVDCLGKLSIDWFGAKNKDLVLNDYGLAFHGYCSYNTNPVGLKSVFNRQGVEPLNYNNVVKNIEKYSNEGLFNIISVHSGIEHVNLASSDDVLFARKLSKLSDYIYFGHHPHVLQGVEKCNNSLLAYSLGNFCFDDVYDDRTNQVLVKQSDNNKSSIILVVTIDNLKITSVEKIPIYQGESKVHINHHLAQLSLEFANSCLKLETSDYEDLRSEKIREINKLRNKKRGLSWLLKRISIFTFLRVSERRINSLKYKIYFSNNLR
jgi:poly-gamma-glutamate synthesis protein (capsule biosynthesis protein)